MTQTPTAFDSLPTITADPAAAPKTESSASKSILASDFQTFLTMLSTQIQNQDPLNPMDSTEFAVQLATFSSVEQQVLTNNLLEKLNTGMAERDMAALAGWIGLEVRNEGPAKFSGRDIRVSVSDNPSATRAELVVSNNKGETIARRDIDMGKTDVVWDGFADDGLPADHGTYTFDIEFYRIDAMLESRPAEAYSRVAEAQVENGTTTLILEGGHRVPAQAISALRDPSISF
ncbi:flagellar hook capping FlgD N-terminal domain-containing protein [Mesobacterium pallidum]|uniref:flagellar hook capping FlgD N-terminal domain-containing protein n=1 Tax=Mesobacterium pallidum TaxID=2872037 RepID=UPI001EE2BF72